MRALGLAAISMLALACGSGSKGGSPTGGLGTGGRGGTGCASVQASCSLAGSICTDYAGQNGGGLSSLQTVCAAMSYSWSTGPCDHTAAVGGCETEIAGVCQVMWVYDGSSTTPQGNCTTNGGTWLTAASPGGSGGSGAAGSSGSGGAAGSGDGGGAIVGSGGVGGAVGGPSGCANVQASCTFANDCSNYADATSAALTGLQAACTTSSGAWSTSSCSTSGALGHCVTLTAGGCVDTWDYAAGTASEGQSGCEKQNGTWYAP